MTKSSLYPVWDLNNAYGDVDSQRFEQDESRLRTIVLALEAVAPHAQDAASVSMVLKLYEEGLLYCTGLIGFCACLGRINIENQKRAEEADNRLQSLRLRMEAATDSVFQFISRMDPNDPFWTQVDFSAWNRWFEDRRDHWSFNLDDNLKATLARIKATNFFPLARLFSLLNSRFQVRVQTADGLSKSQGHTQSLAIVKGCSDPILRRSNYDAMNAFYAANRDFYVEILNALAGYRVSAFQSALSKEAVIEPSFHLNRIRRETVDQMMDAIARHLKDIQRSISLRSLVFGVEKMKVCDLNAPVPDERARMHKPISYAQCVETIQKAGHFLDPSFPQFVDEMLKQGLVETRVSSSKVGGAYFESLPTFKQPRIFTTYLGNQAAMTQQSIMYGHAWQYQAVKYLPIQQTKIPRTLMEVSAHFMAELVAEYEFENAATEEKKFDVLWQQMNVIANYLLSMSVRYDFEKSFMMARCDGIVSTKATMALLQKAWEKWYGSTTDGADNYIWAYRHQFYKTDQFLYNYPYIFGQLIAEGLIQLKKSSPEVFPAIYQAFLADCGNLSVEEVFMKHFHQDITKPEFWEMCIAGVLEKIARFEEFVLERKKA